MNPKKPNPIVGQLLSWGIIIIIAAIVGGTLRTSIDVPNLAGLGQPKLQYDQFKTIDSTYVVTHWLQGLVPGMKANASLFEKPLLGDDWQLLSFKVQTKRSSRDLLFNAITFGIYCPVSVNVKSNWGHISSQLENNTSSKNEKQQSKLQKPKQSMSNANQ